MVDAPGSVPTVKQHLAAIRMLGDWLVVSQVLPVNPAAAVRGPKHVVTEGRDAGPLAGGGEEAPRDDRHGRPGRAPGPGAALGHALQLRAGERGSGDAAVGLLRAGEPELVEAPREGREAARRTRPTTGRPPALDAYVEAGGLEEPKAALFSRTWTRAAG